MMRILTQCCVVFSIGLVLVMSGYLEAAEVEVTVAGSSTIRPIVEKAAKEFNKTRPDAKFVVGGGGSSHGAKATALGEVLIGMASRNLKAEEKNKWKDLVSTKIGLDGIAIIINVKNPVKKISKQQVQDIYTGKITNWKELGGTDSEIMLISKEKGRSTLDLFIKYFGLEAKEIGEGKAKKMVHRKAPPKPKKTAKAESTTGAKPGAGEEPQKTEAAPVKPPEEFSKVTARLIGPNREAIAKVSIKKNAIAYVSIGTGQEVARKGGKIRLLKLDGVEAKVANVANETYPLRRPLNILTKGPAEGIVKEFIEFLMGPEGQKIVVGLEFVPLKKSLAKAG